MNSASVSYPGLPSTPLRKVWLSGVFYLLLFPIFATLAVLAPTSDAPVPTFASVLVGSIVGILLAWTVSLRSTDDRSLVTLIFSGMIVDVAFNNVANRLVGGNAIQLLLSALIGIGNLGTLCVAVGVGLFVGRGMKKPAYLVVAALVGAVSDVISVYKGPSKLVSSIDFFQYMSFQWGLIGHNGVVPIIGAGDFIFLTLFFFGSRKFGLDDRKTLAAMIAAIAAGFLVTLFFKAVPALPFMAAALLLVHGRELLDQMRSSSPDGQGPSSLTPEQSA